MRFFLPSLLLIVSPFVVLPVAAAYLQWAVFGLPPVPASPTRLRAAPRRTASRPGSASPIT